MAEKLEIEEGSKNWQRKVHEIIYEADTPAGKFFDVVLLWLILFSVLLVMLESVEELDNRYHKLFDVAEWVVTILFTLEYIARLVSVKKPLLYVKSFYGMIDLLSTLPKYLSLFIVGSQALVAIRALRLLRIFRILKLHHYMGESQRLLGALRASRRKISVFMFAILILCVILGTVMYLVEGADSGFTSIPRSIYWAIVTLTTVGYGDIAPQSMLGQFIASAIMILGYGIIAIPTGIVTSEIVKDVKKANQISTQACEYCSAENHHYRATYCYQCGEKIH